MGFVIVFLGGGLGSAARYGVGVLALRLVGSEYPWGTLTINVVGSFAMGVVAEYFALRSGLSQPMRLFLTTGIIGGFTTFSTYALETALLQERGEMGAALTYALGSVVVGVAALFAGLALVRVLVVGGAP
ncbi:fluoride efflux transporter CrcB [Methylobacterium organophilum]|uniref:Fluoride-specific ion channel FluC n=1 Tax=Methylobacterium organophilum TaxID=410 RepID=A0ABQ4TAA5_METOR|nr:fluoride efflux transporter CrcB [Methylobacterium organophilum]OAH29562.1 protein CrcB [Methylorubrum populi]GJE27512.1 Putative fluoride ion transporter CrcB [Methylobacterium organophilum]